MTGKLLVAISALLIAVSVYADDWANGSAAFERGDYAAAIGFFESARDAGVSGPAVHYNIAVCQYELERYAEAGKTFAFIGREYPRMAGLAEYNLGLVSRRMDDTVAAAEHFLNAYRLSSNNATIRVLASNQLAEIEPEAPPAASWGGAFGARGGYDDNIALQDTAGIPLGVTTESPMLDIFASIGGPLPNLPDSFSFEGNVYGIRYFDASDFNQYDISAGAFYEWRPGDWRTVAGAYAGAGRLGGDAFDRRIGIGVEGQRSLGSSASASLAYYYDDISEGDDIYAGLRGKRRQFVVRYRRSFLDGGRLLLRLRHENNDRRDPGVSPTRTGLSADYRYLPDTGWGFEAGASYQRSRFDDVTVPRTEQLLAATAGLTRHLRGDWTLLIEFRYSDNDSSDRTFSYDRNTLTIGAMRTY